MKLKTIPIKVDSKFYVGSFNINDIALTDDAGNTDNIEQDENVRRIKDIDNVQIDITDLYLYTECHADTTKYIAGTARIVYVKDGHAVVFDDCEKARHIAKKDPNFAWVNIPTADVNKKGRITELTSDKAKRLIMGKPVVYDNYDETKEIFIRDMPFVKVFIESLKDKSGKIAFKDTKPYLRCLSMVQKARAGAQELSFDAVVIKALQG